MGNIGLIDLKTLLQPYILLQQTSPMPASCLSLTCLQNWAILQPQYTKVWQDSLPVTAELPGQGCCWRLPACSQCLLLPARPAQPHSANADGTRWKAHRSTKHVLKPKDASKTEAGMEARSTRWIQPESLNLNKAQIACWGPKNAKKPKLHIEAYVYLSRASLWNQGYSEKNDLPEPFARTFSLVMQFSHESEHANSWPHWLSTYCWQFLTCNHLHVKRSTNPRVTSILPTAIISLIARLFFEFPPRFSVC